MAKLIIVQLSRLMAVLFLVSWNLAQAATTVTIYDEAFGNNATGRTAAATLDDSWGASFPGGVFSPDLFSGGSGYSGSKSFTDSGGSPYQVDWQVGYVDDAGPGIPTSTTFVDVTWGTVTYGVSSSIQGGAPNPMGETRLSTGFSAAGLNGVQLDFSGSSTSIYEFGIFIGDAESRPNNGTLGRVIVFDTAGNLLQDTPIVYSGAVLNGANYTVTEPLGLPTGPSNNDDGDWGDDTSAFISVQSDQAIGKVILHTGDDDHTTLNDGTSEQLGLVGFQLPVVPIRYDRGDAPVSGLAPNGSDSNAYGEASHKLVPGMHLGGTAADAEAANQATADAGESAAAGDDGVGSDDEDTFSGLTLTQGDTVTLNIPVTESTAGSAYLQAWVDWNGDGDFADSVNGISEQVALNRQDDGSYGDATAGDGVIDLLVSVPVSAITSAATFARFRWSSDVGLGAIGTANDGEVEDYQISINAASSGSPLVCDGTPYTTINEPSELQSVDKQTLASTNLGALTPTGAFINGIAYNSLDNYIYGVAVDKIGGFTKSEIVRLDADRQLTKLGLPVNADPLSTVAWNPAKTNGTMDTSGHYYILSASYVFIVDIGNNPAAGTLEFTAIERTGVLDVLLDITYSTTDGKLYGMASDKLIRVDPDNGFGEYVATTGDSFSTYTPTTDAAGGAWSTAVGDVYIYVNKDGALFRASGLDTATPTLTWLGAVTSSPKFDAAACVPPYLLKDASVSQAEQGSSFDYTYSIINSNPLPISVNFQDILPAHLSYDTGSLTPNPPGSGTVAAFTGTDLVINNITIAGDSRIDFTVTVNVDAAAPLGDIDNQATMIFGGVAFDSDDPDTVAVEDPTTVTIVASPPPPGQVCSSLDLSSHTTTSNAVSVFNAAGLGIGGADISMNALSFVGGATQDESAIDDSQDGSLSGVVTGVISSGPSRYVDATWVFSQPICGFNARIVDIDRSDGLRLYGYLSGTAQAFSVDYQGSSVAYDGSNTFTSNNNVQANPANGNVNEHAIEVSFAGCIDRVTTHYFENGSGGGGSFSFIPSPNPSCWVPGSDYGDAPTSGIAPDGINSNNYGEPSHTVISGIHMGTSAPDTDSAHQPSAVAGDASSGDDGDGIDDEDGVTFPTLAQGVAATIDVDVTQAAADDGYLQAWIDWNGDGDFTDSGEQIATDLQYSAGTSGTIPVPVTPPVDAISSASTFARFRWSSDAGLDATGSAADGEVEDYRIIVVGSVWVSGRVYNDINVDGINDAAEAGISSLPVVLYDTVNLSCISTRTDADGNYTFEQVSLGSYQVYEASRETVPVPQNCGPSHARDPQGYVSTTANVLPAFTVSTAAVTGKDFGDVKMPLFSPDHSDSILPGGNTRYAHRFTPRSSGVVTFSVANNNPATSGWSSILYLDSNCNGQLDGAETSSPLGGSLVTTAGTDICLINRVYAPADVQNGEVYRNVISASFDTGNANAGGTTLSVTDLTKAVANDPGIGSSRLELRKTVENITQSTAETEIQNQAKPGDVLRYRIYYNNSGDGPITELAIKDSVPDFTLLQGGSMNCASTPVAMTCTPNAANDHGLQWSFTGQLAGGQQGSVSYEVKVE